MRDFISRSSIRNTIFMMRQFHRQKTVLIVEGDSDSRSYHKFTRPSSCEVFSPGLPGGKEHALALFNDLKQNRLPGVAALVDADCDRFWGRGRPHVDVCWTSAADREVMIVQSPAFDAFLAANNFRGSSAAFRSQVMLAALPLGCLRIMNRRQNWGLDFKDISFICFIEATRVTCDDRACCDEVLVKNPNAVTDRQTLLDAIETIKARSAALQDVVCGHDLSAIISLVSGNNFTASLTTVDVERQLSKCFELAHFVRTSTYEEFIQWEQRNMPFVINL